MKLHQLLAYVDQARLDGDLTSDSPVFAIVRNATAPLDSPHAWHAISIVGIAADADAGRPVLVADAADGTTDIRVKALVSSLIALGEDAQAASVLVDAPSADSSTPDSLDRSEIIEAYGDEHGLGLMLPFDGYESWLDSQG